MVDHGVGSPGRSVPVDIRSASSFGLHVRFDDMEVSRRGEQAHGDVVSGAAAISTNIRSTTRQN